MGEGINSNKLGIIIILLLLLLLLQFNTVY